MSPASLDWATNLTNEMGEMAWGLSYYMMALNEMYQATGDARYLERNEALVDAVIAARDDMRGILLEDGTTSPAWSSTKYSYSRDIYVVHTSMIVAPVLEFLLLQRTRGYWDEKYTQVLSMIQESIEYHDAEWRYGPVSGEGFYLRTDYRGIAMNQLSSMGRALWYLYKLTDIEHYRDRALALGRYLKNRMTVGPDGAYSWYLLPPRYPVEPNQQCSAMGPFVDDVSHGSLTIALPVILAEEGEIFDKDDLERFSKTVTAFSFQDSGILFAKITGRAIGDPRKIQVMGRWLALSPYSPQVFTIISNFLMTHQEEPSSLDLAMLIRYSNTL